MANCGTSLGHEDCGLGYTVIEREGHKADRDSWQRSKHLVYKRKMAARQQKMKGK